LACVAQADSLNLHDALRQAKQNRPAIASAQLNLDRAKLTARSLGALQPIEVGIGQSSRPDLGATDQDLFISHSLDIFGRTQANRKLGQAGVLSAEAAYKQVLLDVQSEVIEKYFQALTAGQLSKNAENLLGIAESLLVATSRRFEEGKIPEVQVTRAKIERDRSFQTSLLRKSQYKSTLIRLTGATGSAELVEISETDIELVGIDEFNLSARPDLLFLQSELQKAEAEALISRRSATPELELVGLRSPWRDDSTHFGARLQLTWSLYDFDKRKFETESAEKQAEAVRTQISDVRMLAESAVAVIQSEYSAAIERVSSYLELIELNRILVQKTQLGFDQGVGTLIDVLEASRSLREIEEELAEAQLSANLSIAALYHATGTLVEVMK